MAEDGVKGMAADKLAAEAGMKLFMQEAAVELDTVGAEAYKKAVDEQIASLEAEAAALTGKDNKKARTEKSKEASNLKTELKYIDACKVVKGLEPKNGNFASKSQSAEPKAATPVAEEKAEEPKEAKKER
jgi:hypothetical protein